MSYIPNVAHIEPGTVVYRSYNAQEVHEWSYVRLGSDIRWAHVLLQLDATRPREYVVANDEFVANWSLCPREAIAKCVWARAQHIKQTINDNQRVIEKAKDMIQHQDAKMIALLDEHKDCVQEFPELFL